MKKNANSKSQHIVRYMILMSPFFLIFTLLKIVRFPQSRELLELQLKTNSRLLVELKLYVNDDITKKSKNGNTYEPYVSTKVLPFGCEQKDLNKKLSKRKIDNLTNNAGFIYADKKKAFIAFYYYSDYQKGKYNKMINKLWLNFTKSAAKIGMSDEDRLQFLMECHSALTRDIDNLDESFENRFFSMVNDKSLLQLTFRLFISSFVRSSNKLTNANKKKWTKNLKNIIDNYNTV
ncbi:RAD protein [Plasmodium gonderi]|uniref:RAD protein n=1 Tax=Plasmodium gonderi TaxID=77519 RepID=A0A1Y1JB70_PLAGO|nr:RAD protein [Plasmodium gonderi]GAW79781.1 RAD protein [Plasmodium gonderi]